MPDKSASEFTLLTKGTVNVIGRQEPWNNTLNDWVSELKQMPEFNGDINNASEILIQTSRGIKATKDKLQSKGLISYQPPMLGIAYGERARNMSALHNTDENTDAVLISVQFLSNLSRFDLKRIAYLTRSDGAHFFHGYINDFAFLLGVEEAHHSFFTQFKKQPTIPVDGSSIPVDQYDAQEHEYRALLFQRQLAKEEHMPTETIEFLSNRIENAKKIRSSH